MGVCPSADGRAQPVPLPIQLSETSQPPQERTTAMQTWFTVIFVAGFMLVACGLFLPFRISVRARKAMMITGFAVMALMVLIGTFFQKAAQAQELQSFKP